MNTTNCQSMETGLTLLEREAFAQFKTRQHLAKKMKTAREMPSLAIRESRQTIALYRQLEQQRKFARYLNAPDFWSKRRDAVLLLPKKQRTFAYQVIENLAIRWQPHGRYAGYSTEDLLHVYRTIMPLFTHWLAYARRELEVKRGQLTDALAHQYDQWLTALTDELAIEKRQMRQSFYARLMAGLEQQDIRCDNVFLSTQNKLIELGVWQAKQRFTYHEHQGCVMPSTFAAIRYLIEQEGTEQERAAFYDLPYHRQFRLGDMNAPYRYTPQGSSYYIPAEFIDIVPIEMPFYLKLPRFLHFLFFDSRLRYEFFQQPTCQYLLAIEKAYPPVHEWTLLAETTLETLTADKRWEFLFWMLNHLALEKERTQQARNRVLPFQADSASFLMRYEQRLQTLAQTILDRQVSLLEALRGNRLLNENETIVLKRHIRKLTVQSKIWQHTIALTIEDGLASVSTSPVSVEAPDILVSSPPRLTEIHIFDRWYAAIQDVLCTYQKTHPLETLPSHRQTDIQQLTAILKKNSIERDAVQLRADLFGYRQSMSNEWGLPSPALFAGDLRYQLDVILGDPTYSDAMLEAQERVEMKKQLATLTDARHSPAPEPSTEKTKPQLTERLTLSQTLLDHDPASIQKEMAHLLTYEDDLPEFHHQVYGYVYGFLTALAQLPSQPAFKEKLPVIRTIVHGLLTISKKNLAHVQGFLAPVLAAENELERPLYRNHWSLFVNTHFESGRKALARHYGMIHQPTTDPIELNQSAVLSSNSPTPSIFFPSIDAVPQIVGTDALILTPQPNLI